MRAILLPLLLFAFSVSHAADSLVVALNKPNFQPGDTIIFTANASYKKSGSKSTLHVVLEDVRHQYTWKLRYPLLNGKAGAMIVIPRSAPAGKYALNFAVQREYFHILGRMLNEGRKPQQLNCLIMPDKKEFHAQPVDLDDEGYFQITNWYFPNKTHIVFTPLLKGNKNDLNLEIETPLDSTFYPETTKTIMTTIGTIRNPADTMYTRYSFDAGVTGNGAPLDNVVVIGKKKTQGQVYNEKETTGFFNDNGNSYLFDNLEENDIGNSGSIWDYLTGRVMGLDISRNNDSGGFRILWRGIEPDFFLNEVACTSDDLFNVNTTDIAIIKVFRPPFMGSFMGSAGGAVAVYLKKGVNNEGTSSYAGRRHSFIVYGYTPDVYELPITTPEKQ